MLVLNVRKGILGYTENELLCVYFLGGDAGPPLYEPFYTMVLKSGWLAGWYAYECVCVCVCTWQERVK